MCTIPTNTHTYAYKHTHMHTKDSNAYIFLAILSCCSNSLPVLIKGGFLEEGACGQELDTGHPLLLSGQIGKRKPREVMELVQGHTAEKQGLDRTQDSHSPNPTFLPSTRWVLEQQARGTLERDFQAESGIHLPGQQCFPREKWEALACPLPNTICSLFIYLYLSLTLQPCWGHQT